MAKKAKPETIPEYNKRIEAERKAAAKRGVTPELRQMMQADPVPKWRTDAMARRKENAARVADHDYFDGLTELAKASGAIVPLIDNLTLDDVRDQFVGACQRFLEATTVIDDMMESRADNLSIRQMEHNGHRLRVLIWEAGESIQSFDELDRARAIESIRRAIWLTRSVLMGERMPVPGESFKIPEKPDQELINHFISKIPAKLHSLARKIFEQSHQRVTDLDVHLAEQTKKEYVSDLTRDWGFKSGHSSGCMPPDKKEIVQILSRLNTNQEPTSRLPTLENT